MRSTFWHAMQVMIVLRGKVRNIGNVTIFAETPITEKIEEIGEEAQCQNYLRESKRETG